MHKQVRMLLESGQTVTDATVYSQRLVCANYPCSRLAGALHLTLAPKRRKKKALKWSDDTVDNEGMGKKSSKSIALVNCMPYPTDTYAANTVPSPPDTCAECCIFHARRQFGDWSDDSDDECNPAADNAGAGTSDAQ